VRTCRHIGGRESERVRQRERGRGRKKEGESGTRRKEHLYLKNILIILNSE